MKKFFTYFSLSVITIMGIYAMVEMAGIGTTYDGIAKLIVNETVQKTHALNSVTAVVFDFRGYDTLGESFVLFTAITCSAAVLRKGLRKVRDVHEEKH